MPTNFPKDVLRRLRQLERHVGTIIATTGTPIPPDEPPPPPPPPNTLRITTTQLPPGTLNVPYTATLAGTGGTPPYIFGVSALPAGLTINNLTGVISGTPTESGSFAVNCAVIDQLGAISQILLSLVIPAPAVLKTLEMPRADMLWTEGAGITSMTWTRKITSEPRPTDGHYFMLQGHLKAVGGGPGPSWYCGPLMNAGGGDPAAPKDRIIIFSMWCFATGTVTGAGPHETWRPSFSAFSQDLESGGAGGTCVIAYDWVVGETLTFTATYTAASLTLAVDSDVKSGGPWTIGTITGAGDGYGATAAWDKIQGYTTVVDEFFWPGGSRAHDYDFGLSESEWSGFSTNIDGDGGIYQLDLFALGRASSDTAWLATQTTVPSPYSFPGSPPTKVTQSSGATPPNPVALFQTYEGTVGNGVVITLAAA